MATMADALVIGLDYGTDSARAVLVRVADGKELREAAFAFPRWAAGLYCNPAKEQYRQHPRDYIEAAEAVITAVLQGCTAAERARVVGIAFDTTGSTPCFVDERGMPLALQERYATNVNAMFILWKDHTAVQEATEINALAHRSTPDYTMYSGGTYSSEWYWSKALHVLRSDATVANAGYAVLECCEWLPAFFTGVTQFARVVRSRCACGHKAMWSAHWGGFPPAAFFDALHPNLGALRRRMSDATATADQAVGRLSAHWARRFGLSTDVVIAGGGIDAHFGALGAGIRRHTFVRVMGTSTCDMMVIDPDDLGGRCVRGICGQVEGSIVPRLVGLEAGQSAYGDVFAWFARLLQFALQYAVMQMTTTNGVDQKTRAGLLHAGRPAALLRELSVRAQALPPGENGLLALDWFHGRRTPDANQRLRAAIHGLHLGTDAAMIYRALVEATAFGSRAIVERFRREGVRIDDVIAVGGIASKSPLAMQVLADVLNMRIRVCASRQACALGAAIAAATAAGCYRDIPAAQAAMASAFATTYIPSESAVRVYDKLYRDYVSLAQTTERMYAHM